MPDKDTSVLLVEQNVHVMLEVADPVCSGNGHIVYSGAAAEPGADEERIQARAGASAAAWHLDEVLPT